MSDHSGAFFNRPPFAALRLVADDKFVEIDGDGELQYNSTYSLLDNLDAIIVAGDPVAAPIARFIKSSQGGWVRDLETRYYAACADGNYAGAAKLWQKLQIIRTLVPEV